MLFYVLPQSFYTYIFLVRRQLTSLPVLYDQPSEIGAGVYLLLIAQLVAAALFVIPPDELLQRAMVSTLGSRCSLPLAAASPLVGRHFPYHHQHWLWPRVRRCHNRVFLPPLYMEGQRHALREAFRRDRLPNIMGWLAIAVVFAAVTYLQGFCINPSQVEPLPRVPTRTNPHSHPTHSLSQEIYPYPQARV